MTRFFPLMPETNTTIPRMVVLDPSYMNMVAAWVVSKANAQIIPGENENSMPGDGWRLVWRRFSVQFDGPDGPQNGTLLMGRFHKVSKSGRDTLIGGMFRTDIPALLKGIDDLLWQDMDSAPHDGTVVWLRNELMEAPCLGSFGEYHPAMTKTVFMRWSVDRDFCPAMPVRVGSLIKPTQWRPGLGQMEREMPAIAEQTFVRLPIAPPSPSETAA